MSRLVILIVFFLFLGQTPSFSQNYEIDPPPESIKNPVQSQNINSTSEKKEGIFSKIFKKRKQKAVFEEDEGGYKGSLPNVQSEFRHKTKQNDKVINESENAEDYTPDEFQKSKIDDPLFLDVILNKARPSQYNVDMIKVMRFLELFRPIVENHENIQKFNANVNLLDLHARRIEKLYNDKPESQTVSYVMLQNLAYKAKVLGNLKFDANYYSKFSPIAGTKYSEDNLIKEDNQLLLEIDKTIFEIRQLTN